jgi:hypothetical protein
VKFWHVLTGLALLALNLAAALFLIYVPFAQNNRWDQLLKTLGHQPWLAAGAGIILFALALLYLLTASHRQREGEQYLSFENEGGTVSISLRAVRDYLGKLSHEFAAISSLQPLLSARGGGLTVELDLKVRAGAQIPELCRMLQDRVRESIQNNFGISDVKAIKINVREIVGTPMTDPRDAGPVESGPFEG